MFGWLEDAWDATVDFFGGGDDLPVGDPTSSIGQSVLSDLDIDDSGSIGDMPISDYQPGYDYSSFDSNYGMAYDDPAYRGDYYDYNPDAVMGPNGKPVPANQKGPLWERILTSPGVLGAGITSLAGYLKGMSELDIAKQQQKAAEEAKRMNQMLELAKLKYQLMGKGASGSGGRRGGGSSGANRSDAINNQYSAQKISGFNNLANNLSAIYRS